MTTPLSRDFKVINSAIGSHVFATNGSRIFDVDDATAYRVGRLFAQDSDGGAEAEGFRTVFGSKRQFIEPKAPNVPNLRALSLNVAQACNLGCSYCYADTGLFGGKARVMSADTARQSVDRLLKEAGPGTDVVVGFMGGEPLLNRKVIHDATIYASQQAHRQGGRAKFSITTNATTVTPEDAQLFKDYGFMVTISIDGPKSFNDKMRPSNSGKSSYDAALRGIALIMSDGGPAHTAVRVTVTPQSNDLLGILEHMLSLGVGDAGFAPVQVSPATSLEFQKQDFDWFLDEMKHCGEAAKLSLMEGRRFPFSNFETALNEIHRGSHRPYPCGAGAAYLSVNADGDLYGCHRLVDTDGWQMGNVKDGLDEEARIAHLERRHVDRQEPCKSCWARYLCGGGCYHEVDQKGRLHCDYVRGWLEFCISAYAELSALRPNYFVNPNKYFDTARPIDSLSNSCAALLEPNSNTDLSETL